MNNIGYSLNSYILTIMYKAGKENNNADALSRRPQYADLLAISIVVLIDFSNCVQTLQDDEYTRDLLVVVQTNPTSHPDFHVADSKLFYKNCLFIPNNFDL